MSRRFCRTHSAAFKAKVAFGGRSWRQVGLEVGIGYAALGARLDGALEEQTCDLVSLIRRL